MAIDSRAPGYRALFFALRGSHTDGHAHLAEAFAGGTLAAVVSRDFAGRLPGPAVRVDAPLRALQRLAGWWRRELSGRLVAITGSNGKTILKDALVHILSLHRRVGGTPGSYNSQLGVPLALLRIGRSVEVAVCEAGVSAPGEMDALERVLRPDCGILTNVGLAHIGSFGSREAIAGEKRKLFRGIRKPGFVLAPGGDPLVQTALESLELEIAPRYFGGPSPSGDLPRLVQARRLRDGYLMEIVYPQSSDRFEVRTEVPSREILANLEAALAAAHLLGMRPSDAVAALDGYRPPHTRLEIWRSPARGITVINDSCSSDPVSVKAALHSLRSLADPERRRVFVFGGMRELGELSEPEHAGIGRLAGEYGVDALVLVGEPPDAAEGAAPSVPGGHGLEASAAAYLAERGAGQVLRAARPEQVQALLQDVLGDGDYVLFKGPRNTGIDRAALSVLDAMAPNRLSVDLQALAENVRVLRRVLGPHTRLLGMVKALAYGSNLERVGSELERLGVDALGVSTVDEGSELRRAGVLLPILVMLCTAGEASKLVKQRLTPVVYAFDLVAPLAEAARRAGARIDVHLKVDTGLGRLGVFPEQVAALAERVQATGVLAVRGIMTHFASAEDPAEDAFTTGQIERFEEAVRTLRERGHGDLVRHAAGTAAALRFPRARYDMVRVGLGLYGVYPSGATARALGALSPSAPGSGLVLAVSLLSRVSEVRDFPRGSRIGYGGTYVVGEEGLCAAVLPIGYHDGVPREIARGGSVWIHGRRCPVVGRVSMDSMVVDVSGAPDASEGSDALFYGTRDGVTARPEELAEAAGTIPHELLSRIGPRVQRVFLG